jgi:hypothetical protein
MLWVLLVLVWWWDTLSLLAWKLFWELQCKHSSALESKKGQEFRNRHECFIMFSRGLSIWEPFLKISAFFNLLSQLSALTQGQELQSSSWHSLRARKAYYTWVDECELQKSWLGQTPDSYRLSHHITYDWFRRKQLFRRSCRLIYLLRSSRYFIQAF